MCVVCVELPSSSVALITSRKEREKYSVISRVLCFYTFFVSLNLASTIISVFFQHDLLVLFLIAVARSVG